MNPSLSRVTKAFSPAQVRFEQQMVEVFGELADLFGNPRSHGQIFGVLFSSTEPLLMEEISKRTGISLGSASLGLRALEDLGVVHREACGRIGYYTARMELRTLVNGFIRHRLIPRLDKSSSNLEASASLLPEMSPDEAKEASWRLQRVTQWHSRAIQFLPLAQSVLESALIPPPNGK